MCELLYAGIAADPTLAFMFAKPEANVGEIPHPGAALTVLFEAGMSQSKGSDEELPNAWLCGIL
jgi:hypothetical protein